jgi:hypothetical protein
MKTNYQKKELQFFFCIGCRKSGTTLLAKLLDRHPQIACIWESYALIYNHKSSIMNPDSDAWKKHGFAREKVLRLNQIWVDKPNFYWRFMHKLTGYDYIKENKFRITMSEALTDFAERCNASVVGDKWPWYIDNIELVIKAFPKAKFIYNVRDPRGIWNSAQRFKERQKGDVILQEMLDKDRKISPYLQRSNFITIRYEDLVNNPKETLKQLYQFLGVDCSTQYLVDNQHEDPYPQRWSWIPETSESLNPWHSNKWQEQMNPHDIERVTNLADWFIEKYQYSVSK